LAARGATTAGQATGKKRQGKASEAVFAPVIVTSALPSLEAPVAPNQGGGTAAIEIVLGAATVRVAPGINTATLTTVLRVVRAAT
jgi:hypothetical protein